MKTTCILLLLGLATCANGRSVQFYHNPRLLAAMTENQGARSGAEFTLNEQAKKIMKNLGLINANMFTAWQARELVYKSLTEVDEALKDGREVRYIGELVSDIFREAGEMAAQTAKAPQYAPLARDGAQRVRKQALNLFDEIARFVNKGGREAMMNHNTRDELLRDITHRLQLLRADISVMRRSVQWAAAHGAWKNIGPFAEWANRDRQIMDDIIRKAETLK